MDEELKNSKQALRAFMRANYSDERLAWLLAHAREGKLHFLSCCCFIGVATADHALRGRSEATASSHYIDARLLPGASEAESAFLNLYSSDASKAFGTNDNDVRRRRLIPIIKAEMRRRQRERESCLLCVEPLNGEQHFHLACARRENMQADVA